jgi:hypothetical protein
MFPSLLSSLVDISKTSIKFGIIKKAFKTSYKSYIFLKIFNHLIFKQLAKN